MTDVRWPRRWPVAVISLPAAVATWSGWVGLGEMTGFGKVKLLPGIWDSLKLNTAVTLPIGVEAYAAFALSAALTSAPVSKETRRFAWISSVCALGLGMGAQIAYHLLKNADRTAAPWQITTVVSCLPVLVLGLGAVLAHMLHRDRTAFTAAPQPVVDPATVVLRPATDAPEITPAPVGDQDEAPTYRPDEPVEPLFPDLVIYDEDQGATVPAAVPDPDPAQVRAATVFADEIAKGDTPSIRAIKAVLRCGQDKAQDVQAYLSVLASQ